MGGIDYSYNSKLIKIGGCGEWIGGYMLGSGSTPIGRYQSIFSEEEFELIKQNSDLFDVMDVFSLKGDEVEFNAKKFIKFLMKLGKDDCNLDIIDILAEKAGKQGFLCNW
jgi:hypothetical protein